MGIMLNSYEAVIDPFENVVIFAISLRNFIKYIFEIMPWQSINITIKCVSFLLKDIMRLIMSVIVNTGINISDNSYLLCR